MLFYIKANLKNVFSFTPLFREIIQQAQQYLQLKKNLLLKIETNLMIFSWMKVAEFLQYLHRNQSSGVM